MSRRRVRHRVRWALSAGKHNVPATQTARFLADLVDEFDLQFVGTTEAQAPGIVEAVREALGKDWQVRKPGEYLGAWRRDTLAPRVHEDGNAVAIERRFSDVAGLPDWQNVFGGIFRLEHIASGRPFTPVVFHSNSGIEMGDGFRRGAGLKVAASRTGLTRLGNWARRRLRRQPALMALVMGDANVNQFRPAWRRYMAETLGGRSVWRDSRNTVGDHGNRLIVLAHVFGRGVRRISGRIIRRNEIRYPDGYDHGALVGTLVFTAPTRDPR